MKIRKIAFVGSIALLLGSSLSQGLIYIDDFTTAQFLPGVITGSSGYVSGPGILGTERDAEAYAPTVSVNSAVPGQLLAFDTTPNWGTIILTYDGVDNNTSMSFLNGLGDVDLTQGGINDRFRIAVTAANNRGGWLTVTVRNINSFGSSLGVPLPTSAGVLDLRFADFQSLPFGATHLVNFADVGYIDVNLGLNPGESYTIDSIAATVPEPNAIALAGGALLLLLLRQSGTRDR